MTDQPSPEGVPDGAPGGDPADAADDAVSTVSHPDEPGPTLRWASVVSVWVGTLIATIVVGVAAAPAQYFTWLPLVLVGALLGTFVLQLALQSKEELVLRVSASTAGAVLIVAAATAVLAPLALA